MAWTGGGVLLMLALAAPTWAQQKEKLDPQEEVFLKQRAQDDLFMWRLGEYAVAHADGDRVKKLGQAIIEERRTDLREIQQVAKNHDVNLEEPKDLTIPQRTMYCQRGPHAGTG